MEEFFNLVLSFTYQPTPLIPLPYKGGGGFFKKEGLALLLNTPLG